MSDYKTKLVRIPSDLNLPDTIRLSEGEDERTREAWNYINRRWIERHERQAGRQLYSLPNIVLD